MGWTHDSRLHFASTSGAGAAHLVHVGGRAADVRDDPGELGILPHPLQLVQDRFLRTRLDDPPLMRGDRAERAAAETASHDRDRVLDNLVRGILCPLYIGCGRAGVGQPVDPVHVLLADRQRRRVADDRLPVVKLHEAAGVERVGLLVDDLGRRRELLLVGLDLLI